MKLRTILAVCLLAMTAAIIATAAEPQRPAGPGSPGWVPPQTPASAIDKALDSYAQLSGKTILRSTVLPNSPDLDLSSLPPDKAAALAQIESLLATNGITIVQDGPHFVRVFPTGQQDLTNNPPLRGAELADKAPSASGTARSQNEQILQAGMINFPGTDLNQVLMIYAELRNRTILRPGWLPASIVSFKNTCPMSKEEAAYALATVFGLNGLAAVDDGDHFVQVVPRVLANAVRTNAPKPNAGSSLLDATNIPVVGVATLSTFNLPREKSSAAISDAGKRCAERLLSYYAELAGKNAEPFPTLGDRYVYFWVQTALTKDEVLYAIEKTFALNNLKIVTTNNTVRLAELSGP